MWENISAHSDQHFPWIICLLAYMGSWDRKNPSTHPNALQWWPTSHAKHDVNIDKWCWHWYLDLPHRGKIMVLKLLFPQDGTKPPPLFSNNGQALEIRRTPLFSSNSCKKRPRFVANGFFLQKMQAPSNICRSPAAFFFRTDLKRVILLSL